MIDAFALLRHKLPPLIIISFILAYFAGKDAINNTILYNKLDLEDTLLLKIENKYNKKSWKFLPDLNFRGNILSSGKQIEVHVSKGDFDKHKIGQVVKVFKTASGEYMTEYELDNLIIINIGKYSFSFIIILSAIFYLIALFSLLMYFKTRNY